MRFQLKTPPLVAACINHLCIYFLCTLCLLFSPAPNYASEATDADTAWTKLREGTAIAIMRHALAPGTGDPANFVVDDCSTQRNLSDEGRSQAGKIGDKFRKNGIASAQIFSSEWCRCQETARILDIGDPKVLPALNSFFQNRSTAQSQTAYLREALPGWLQAGSTPILLVTHQVNIRALTGSFTSSGEILIISLEDDDVVVLASITDEN